MELDTSINRMARHVVFLTGAAGYVGGMLVDLLAQRDDVELVIGLDKEPLSTAQAGIPKLNYIHMNTADAWEEEVARYKPDIVINTAWQIRDIYGNVPLQRKWNIDGTNKVFDFALNTDSVETLVDFSTVSSYAPFPENEVDHFFKESEPFRKCNLRYAEEKREVEESLKNKYDEAVKAGKQKNVVVLRPAAITGPRGRFGRDRFGLQAALSGQLAPSFWYRVVMLMTAFVPATPKWVRQFIHEDDVADITFMAALAPRGGYEVFNICPPGDPVFAKDMAKAVGKWVLPIRPWMARFAFFIMWHMTHGKVPTAPYSWMGYSYPIVVDGSKLTKEYGYAYRMSSFEAFYYTDGRYASVVPEVMRRSIPGAVDSRVPRPAPSVSA